MRRPEIGELLILPHGYAPYLYEDIERINPLDCFVVKSGTPMIVLEVSDEYRQARVLTPTHIGWIGLEFFLTEKELNEEW